MSVQWRSGLFVDPRPTPRARPRSPRTAGHNEPMTTPRPLAVPGGPDALTVLPALEAALAGGSPILPYAAELAPPVVAPHVPTDLPEGLALAVGTSGSTGR